MVSRKAIRGEVVRGVILAAGKGSRLGDNELPKPLTLLENGYSILGMQIDSLRPYLCPDALFVVIGYRKEMILDRYPELTFVYNPSYAEQNTSKSLLRALNKIQDDVIWINGDVVFHPSVLPQLVARKDSCMVVNQAVVSEEEVKYKTDSKGWITEVSKQVQNPQGEALGINFFMKRDLPLLIEGLEACKPTDYFERGIELAIQKGVKVAAHPIANELCMEIDFPEDLVRANEMVRKWAKL